MEVPLLLHLHIMAGFFILKGAHTDVTEHNKYNLNRRDPIAQICEHRERDRLSGADVDWEHA